MTTHEAIQKMRILLGAEAAETQRVEMAQATLVDGTVVETEGDLEVGKALSVITEEGPIAAPEGMHETTEGLLVTVDEAGVITQIEEVSQEEEMKEKEEVAMEEEKEKMEIEDEMIIKIVEAMQPFFEEIKEVKAEIEEMKGKFQKFSKEPAAKPVKKAEAFEANKLTAVERIAKIRKTK